MRSPSLLEASRIVAFPLTPALSRRERESRSQSLLRTLQPRTLGGRTPVRPLPQGEGEMGICGAAFSTVAPGRGRSRLP